MHTQFKKSALTTSLLAALAISCNAGSAGAADTIAQNNLEARQEAQIQTTYDLSPYLRAIDLKVSVHGDKATLSGKVNENAGKELAEQIALSANGIKSVDNQIVVDPEYVPSELTSPDRKYGEIVDDASITAVVKSKLLWSKHADGLSTNVDTNRGKVTLTGTAENTEAKAFAGQLAKNTNGVKSVDNRLEIKPKAASDTSNGTLHNTGEAISDTWITTKVKSTFMYSSDVNSSDISVATSEGVVTLTGNLTSTSERNLAIELAQNLRGVKKVNAEGLIVTTN
jgi:hyperosmotically inducible periplasmic protein